MYSFLSRTEFTRKKYEKWLEMHKNLINLDFIKYKKYLIHKVDISRKKYTPK
jgi:hypothetical protein